MVVGQFLYDEPGGGCHLAAFGNGRAREQTLQPLGHFRWGVESFDKCIPGLGRQDEMVLVRQVHLSLSASRIDYVLGEVGVAPRRAGLNEAGLARGGTNVESLRLGKLVLRGVWHVVPILIVRLLYACSGVNPQAALAAHRLAWNGFRMNPNSRFASALASGTHPSRASGRCDPGCLAFRARYSIAKTPIPSKREQETVCDLEVITSPSALSSVFGVRTPVDVKGISLPPSSTTFSSESTRRPLSGDFQSGGTPTRLRLRGRVECESQAASAFISTYPEQPAYPLDSA